MALAIGALAGWVFGAMVLAGLLVWLTRRKPHCESLQQRMERYSKYRRHT